MKSFRYEVVLRIKKGRLVIINLFNKIYICNLLLLLVLCISLVHYQQIKLPEYFIGLTNYFVNAPFLPQEVEGFKSLKNIFAATTGLYFAVIVGYFQIARIMREMWIAFMENENDEVSTLESAIVGWVERIFYFFFLQLTLIQANAVLAIGFWLALKTAGRWRIWPEEHIAPRAFKESFDRTAYQIFLIGNALSIGYAFLGWKISIWLSKDDFLYVLFSISFAVIGCWLLRWIVKSWAEDHLVRQYDLSQLSMHDDAMQGSQPIKMRPELAKVFNSKGMTLWSQGKYADANKAFEKAVEVNPRFGEAWHNKGIYLKKIGDGVKAEEALAKAKELGYKE